uniref:Protein MON2 homolog n=1 Tax=Meloidogyne javanica TaxID=6303 RepID=A0A915MV75_MELJA
MSDFRSLSMDAKKKHNHAAESGLVKIRNINAACESQQDSDLIQALRISCTELLHPFLLGCSSKNPRLVQISLQAIQRLIHNRVIESNVVPAIVNELWILTEAECEELKVIQTITPFVGTELFVNNWALAKCIVLTFRLNASKDSLVINAASAAVRQLFSSPPSLRPAAADAFLLLRDLCALIRREQPSWLIGLQRIAPILGLELLESVIKNYPSIFLKHQEFAELLKTQISAQIAAKMLHVGEREFAMLAVAAANATQANNVDNQNKPLPVSAALLNQQLQQQSSHLTSQMAKSAASSSSTGRDFPIVIRSLRISLALVTNYHSLLGAQSEAIIHFLIELLAQHPSTSWEAAVAIEVLHKMLSQPKLLSWLCTRPDGSKFLEAIVFSRLFAFIRKCLDEAAIDGSTMRDGENNAQPGFVYKGVFLPLGDGHPSSKRLILLDWLDKHNAEKIPEAYCLSLTYATFCVASRSLHSAIEEDFQNHQKASSEYSEFAKELYNSSYHFLVAGLSTLLDCSVDDSLNEQLLNCICSLAILALRLQLPKPRREVLKAICRATLPFQYYNKFIDSIKSSTTANGTLVGDNISSSTSTDDSTTFDPQKGIEHNIVAMGTVCPSPYLPPQLFNTSVMLTAKNLQVLRILVNLTINNGSQLSDCWEMVLTTLQHFVWIIGLRPSPTGSFRTGMNELSNVAPVAEANSNTLSSTTTTNASAVSGVLCSNTVILTNMASSELPDINQQLGSLFESTSKLDEVSLHHVIAALCKLSNETMTVAQHSLRETSFFSFAKLQQAALVNLPRLHVFWRPVTAHLLELCSHSNNNIREWGSISLTKLVEEGMKQVVGGVISEGDEEITKKEQLILSPLCSMNEISFSDVRAKQLDCLMKILQADNRTLETPLWPFIVQIVRSIVATDTQMLDLCGFRYTVFFSKVDPQLIDQGFRALSLMVKEFLSVLPFECVEMLVETNALYGQQQLHLNWDISDFVRRETNHGKIAAEVDQQQIWLLIYQALGNLCSDPRPPVRKSACDTLLQTVAAHGQALNIKCWEQMLIEILFPMLCRVHQCAQTASTQRSNTTNSLGAPNLMIHHSRDTESKQWAETSVKTLGGVVKIFNAHRPSLLQLENFSDCWSQLLRHIVLSARTDSAEISLSAVKNFQELLFGRQQQTNSESSSILQSGNKSPSTPGSGSIKSKLQQYSLIDSLDHSLSPSLPEPLWITAWSNWLQIARSILAPDFCETTGDAFLSSTCDIDSGYSKSVVLPTTRKSYVPSLYHLSTLLETFIWLFHRVRQQVPVDDIRLQCLGQIFIDLASVPISADQIPISTLFANTKNGSEQQLPLNMAQEYLFSCTRAILQEQIDTKNVNSGLRAALPDMLRLLILWMQFSWKKPQNKFISDKSSSNSLEIENIKNNSNLITFGETSMKMLLEFYSKTAAYEEVIQHTILVDIVKAVGEPLALKYSCPSQTTWQLAAATLNKVCQVGIPIARENVNLFKQLWPCLANVVENFLFSNSKSSKLLNADERKRHEFVDCLLVELLRAELLPFANKLPRDFMISIIDILNRGSINTIDANDVLASDLHEQRTDLSRVCFDALLSLSQMEEETNKPISSSFFTSSPVHHRTDGGFLRNTTSQSHRQAVASAKNSSSLGATAISSLLNRCKQVLNCFARDEQRCGGHFPPLPQERVFEAISALRAVSALIDGFSRNPTSVLYSHLVTLHPNLVQLIPSSRCDQQLELALMTCLNSYQTLLLLNLHINENK